MIKPLSTLAVLALITLAGCKEVSSRGGDMDHDHGFRVIVPQQINLRQGAAETINVTLYRDDAFKQNVKLKLKAPSGIDLDPSSVTIKASAGPDAMVKVSVDKDAALGDYYVGVTGTPETGTPVNTGFTVKVVAP